MKKAKDFLGEMVTYLKEWRGILLILYLFSVLSINIFVKWEGELSLFFAFRLIIALAFAICICPIILWELEKFKICLRDTIMTKKEKALWIAVFFLLSFVILLRWYLAYYPGAFSSDALYQYRQTLSGKYHNWKPILQTLLTFTLPFKLTGRADCVVLFQVVEYSCILTYMAYILLKYGGKCYAVLSLLYILLNPVTGNIVVCPWKDVTFAMFAVLLLTFGLQIHITDGKWLESKLIWWTFGIVLVIATFVRHNGFLFTVPFIIAVLIRLGRKKRFETLLFLFVCFSLLKGCLYPILSVNQEWNYKTRVLGLPMTVLGNVAKESPDALDDSTREFLYLVAPEEKWQKVYQCGNFNSIKWQTDQPYIEETGAVNILTMAAKSVFRAPIPALKSFFSLTDMVYAIGGDTDWKITLSIGENNLGIEFHEICEKSVLEDYTEFSKESVLKYFFWRVGVINLIILSAILCKCRFGVKESLKKILFGLPVLCYNFGTMFLLSGNDFRYFYYSFPVFPVVFFILFVGKNEQLRESGKKELSEKQRKKNRRDKINVSKIIEKSKSINIRATLRVKLKKTTEIFGKWISILKTIPSRLDKVFVVYTFLFSCMFVIGEKISMGGPTYFQPMFLMDFLKIVLLFLSFLIVGSILLRSISSKRLIEIQMREISGRWWLYACVFLAVLWSPYLLAYYPGTLSPDSFTSLIQVKNLELLYNHVPVAYTLLIAFFARIGWTIGDANFGIFLFTFVQMMIMAGVLSYSAYWLRKKVRYRIVAYATLLFYGLNPIVALYSITMWKDVLYSAWIVLLCQFLFDMAMNRGERLRENKSLVQLGLLFVLVSFGRNNGVYVVIFCWLGLLLIYKNIRKKLFIAGGRVILSILLIQGPGYKALGINQVGFAESVGIPLQQICYTVITDGPLEEKDQEFLENIIPIRTIEESYSPASADNIKFNAEFDTTFFEQNKLGFVKLYFKLLPSHLRAYIQGYLLSTSGFWHVESINWVAEENIYENDMGIYNVDYLKKFFHYDCKESVSRKITSLRSGPATNIGLMVWFVFFYVVACLSQKQPWKAVLVLPLIGCWLTLMIATPVNSQFRYVYYYHLMLPIVGIMFFTKRVNK